MRHLLSIILLCGLSTAVYATELPVRIEISYKVRTILGNGKLKETIEIVQESNTYRITSDARPAGMLKVVKPNSSIVRDSQGVITKLGLIPQRFSDRRDDDRPSIAIFDWNNNILTLEYPDEEEQEYEQKQAPLPVGTQDRLSMPYNFMFSPLTKAQIDMHETDGRTLTLARYTVHKEMLKTPLGNLETIVLTRQSKKHDKIDRKIWLATAHHMLPVRILATEEDGLKLEQMVTKIHYPQTNHLRKRISKNSDL